MSLSHSIPADRIAVLRTAPPADQARIRASAALENLLLALLAALLGQPRRAARIWHPNPETNTPAPLRTPQPSDHTHAGIVSPLLYVIGPGPNRGLVPHARPTPRMRPRSARAPPPESAATSNQAPRRACEPASHMLQYSNE